MNIELSKIVRIPILAYRRRQVEKLYSAFDSSDDLFRLLNDDAEKRFSMPVIWSALVKYQKSSPGEFLELVERLENIASPDLRFLLYLRKGTVKGLSFHVDWDFVFKGYSSLKGGNIKGVSRSLIMDLIVRSPDPSLRLSKFAEFGWSFNDLTSSQKFRLLQNLSSGDKKDLFLQYLAAWEPNFNSVEKLKLELMKTSICRTVVADFHSYFEEKLLNIDCRVAENYASDCGGVYHSIDDKFNLLDSRFDVEKRRFVRELILGSVRSLKSFCFIRLGDGECYGFDRGPYLDERGLLRQELHWWGEELHYSQRITLQNQFQESVRRASAIGIPTAFRIIKEFSGTDADLSQKNTLISRIFSVVSNVQPFLGGKYILEDQSNLFLFNDEFLSELFLAAKKVIIISGLNSDGVKRWSGKFGSAEYISIPSHRLFKNESFSSSFETSLPHVYIEFMESISKLAGPGVVFLISAGFIGKIFAGEAASNGSVAIDIGQLLANQVAAL